MTEVSFNAKYRVLVEEGIKAAEEGNTRLALSLFDQLKSAEITPLVTSYLAYCHACEQKNFKKALDLSIKALQGDRSHPLIYLNLGRIYLAANLQKKAMQTFRRGLRCQRHPLLLRQLERVSSRRTIAFPFLQRSNPLNIIIGKIFSKVF